MLYTCQPGCANPLHKHSAAATKTSAAKKLSVPVKKPAGKGKQQLRIDMHCHYFNPEVGKKGRRAQPW
jgi:hypothetical protein